MNELCDTCKNSIGNDLTLVTMSDKEVRRVYTLCSNLECRLVLLKLLCEITQREIDEVKARAVSRADLENASGIKKLAPNILSHPCNVVLILATGEAIIEGKKDTKKKE
ncbi:MAG: hypothetical protein HY225_01695 [Candidatus Vogelbacteria bacterium]|nr:hypothetical protein [Candidatus Vogelbacteria bacterium]